MRHGKYYMDCHLTQSMKSNLELKALEKIGANRESFIAFLEIARHPDGLSLTDVAHKIGAERNAVRYHILEMKKCNFITTGYGITNGKSHLICKATPYGVDLVGKDLKSVCALMTTIQEEMIKTCRVPKK